MGVKKGAGIGDMTLVLSLFKKKPQQGARTFTPQDLHSKVLLTNPSDTTKASVCDFSQDSRITGHMKFKQGGKKSTF